MGDLNEINREVARLETRVDNHDDMVESIQENIHTITDIQNSMNLILSKLTTVLEHTNTSLDEHKKIDEAALKQLMELAARHSLTDIALAKTNTKLKILWVLLGTVGTALIGLLIKFIPLIGG